MKASRHNTKRAKNRKDCFSVFVTLLLISSLLFYQLLPLSIARAEEPPTTESPALPAEETEPEPVEEETPPAEEEKAEEPEADAALGSEATLEEESAAEEPAEAPTETTIENTNAAVVENEAGLVANTGENAANENAVEEGDPCKEDNETESIEGSTETLNEENITEEELAECPAEEEEEKMAPAEETATLQTEEAPLVEEAAAVVPLAENPDPKESKEDDVQEETDQAENASQEENTDPEIVPEPTNPANQLDGGPASPSLGGPVEPILSETETPAEEPVAEITTGDAQAVVNIFNDLNANLTGANWESLILNIEGAESGDIDLLREFLKLLEKASQPDEEQEFAGNTEIKNDNQAEVTNNVTVEANSGTNTANDNGGGATIETGNASALANIVNFLNRNFTGNNWLFAVINIFGSLSGNIIVPGEGLLTLPGPGCGSGCLGDLSEVSNSNSADIDNNVTAVANTGGNAAEGNQGGAEIVTGDAVAVAEVKNIANTNITGSHNWFFLLINNMGSWIGKVLNWNAESNSYETAYSYAFEGEGPGDPSNSAFSVENLNSAKVTNNVTVLANTGDNSASGNAGGASIRTGNAGAFANILNFVNANITGNNWFFGMINILGEWTGNLEFAYPDLQVSISDGKNSAEAGDTLVYQIKYKNAGKADAENVQLKAAFSNYVSGDDQTWDIGSLAAGQEGAYEVSVKIADPMPAGKSVLESAAGIATATREVEGTNNTAVDYTDVVYDLVDDSGNDEVDFDPGLRIRRNGAGGQVLYPGNIIHHEIIVENSGDGPIMDIEVKDKVADAAGNHLTTLTWQAGDLKQGKSLMITYDLLINSSIPPGSYAYSATAQGEDYFGDSVESKKANLVLAIGRLLGGTALASTEPEAAAATEVRAAVLGEEFPVERGFPLWVWMLAAMAYYLAINWSLFPKKVKLKL